MDNTSTGLLENGNMTAITSRVLSYFLFSIFYFSFDFSSPFVKCPSTEPQRIWFKFKILERCPFVPPSMDSAYIYKKHKDSRDSFLVISLIRCR